MADEAVCVGPALSSKSYLNIPAILRAVKSTGAQAVHPGYGFLSENSEFAVELQNAGVVFLGPNSKAISVMSDKIESKRIAMKANVNVIPGYDGEVSTFEEAIKIADKIGYPVMIKASAGAGGKGMRIVWNAKEVRDAFRLCKAESMANFGDGRMLIEKYIDSSRHIEIQVLCDRHGNAIYLNERECSVQRRHQKLIEEAPSTFVDDRMRQAMGEQAVTLAKAVGYDSAGTVEFLVDPKRNFYFLEMNTRIQVEHPVTECITGVDIVHQMLRIGCGQKLLLKQSDITARGWALECRVYAEDPHKSFGLPSVGRLYSYVEPTSIPNVRCDSGMREGSEVSTYYDPLICKLITYAPSRQDAIDTMVQALDSYVIRGVTHNIPLLRNIITEEHFVSGEISTNYLAETYPNGFRARKLSPKELRTLIAVASAVFVKNAKRDEPAKKAWDLVAYLHPDASALSPEGLLYSRCNVESLEGYFSVGLSPWQPPKKANGDSPTLEVDHSNGRSHSKLEETVVNVVDNFQLSDQVLHVKVDGDSEIILQLLDRDIDMVQLQYLGTVFPVQIYDSRAAWYRFAYMLPLKAIDSHSVCAAPMSGRLHSVSVQVGDRVSPGQELCVLEAMKMYNSLSVGKPGIVKEVNFKAGDTVANGDIIVVLA
ncbi:unnamed protein product [Calicophoron daubneyi]|uniref:Propionyl-CoA carboxylase alpha chain, mitochondrial n=1 Tax=Calicophoron daubneyi TaxID=300641 RepID=A0AAV2TDU1_CALDB